LGFNKIPASSKPIAAAHLYRRRLKFLPVVQGKLLNHSNVTKIGVFISYNGFTSEANTHIKRMSRGTQHLVFVTGENLRTLANREKDVLEWLEELFSVLR
jgi:hypothetical protein